MNSFCESFGVISLCELIYAIFHNLVTDDLSIIF